ncbi:MAG: type I DNA topoisomerase [Bacteroidales bacterium]|nr:type I DNA topoisomerase [Bacteroidales bacterium]
MTKNLVIVESPAKAKTIEGFLGKDFTVKSCYGHVRDLPNNALGVNIDDQFYPEYEVPADKKAVVGELKKHAGEAETVWLATDEDREGEAISWHLAESLGLKPSGYKRIVFHEITKKAILNAIEHPRGIDENLVNAQQARRVLDRLVGFELSPLLWKKVKPALSAGRVQSVAVRLIVEREKAIQAFKTSGSYKITAHFVVDHNGQTVHLKAELPQRFSTKEEARRFLEACKGAVFTIEDIETKPLKKSPAPPFTTSTLQQEASRKLGFSVSRTMLLAQKLYESGKITYMRTDSYNLSNTALAMAKEIIENNFGSDYVKLRKYSTKSKGAQEAHEAIRPVDLHVQKAGKDTGEQKLYELIWKRTLASQMSDARLEKTNITIGVSTREETFIATGEVIKFDGFLKVYFESTDDDDEETASGMLPPVTVGQQLPLAEMSATERFTKPLPRYAEASLVKKLEELGIGRPSTYAPTISTIQKRAYVVKESIEGTLRPYHIIQLKNDSISETQKKELTGAEKNKLFPTDIGQVVNSFLMEFFSEIMDYRFTARVEREFDEIAEGRKEWVKVIHEFYWPFHRQVENTLQKSQKYSGQRLLGKDPESGRNVYAKIGRFGSMIQIGDPDDQDKPRFTSLRKDQSLDTISLDEALDLFKLPRFAGEYEGKEMLIGIGRFGPYIKHDGKFFSIPAKEDPLSISTERAVELIEEKKASDREKIIRSFDEDPSIQVLKGRWGPYISADKKNYKLPKNTDPETLSFEEVKKIIADGTSEGKSRKTKRKSPPGKKA